MFTAIPGGQKYLITLIDSYSKYTSRHILTQKSQAELVIKKFINYTHTDFGKKTKKFLSDRRAEYIGHSLKEYLQNRGIKFQYTMPNSPEQNGLAKRKNRDLMEAVRAMLIDAKLPNTYWGEAVMTATYLQYRLLAKTRSQTPYELWFGEKLNVSHLRIFECHAYSHIPREQNKNSTQKRQNVYSWVIPKSQRDTGYYRDRQEKLS